MMRLVLLSLIFFMSNLFAQDAELTFLDRDSICLIKCKNTLTNELCICVLDQEELFAKDLKISADHCSKNCAFWDFCSNAQSTEQCTLNYQNEIETKRIKLTINTGEMRTEIIVQLEDNLEFQDALLISL